MSSHSISCRKVGFGQMEQPGDFTFDEERETIYIWLPGVSGPDALKIQRGKPGGERVWGWDGNEILPTLEPSILHPGCWHGYLKNGYLVSC